MPLSCANLTSVYRIYHSPDFTLVLWLCQPPILLPRIPHPYRPHTRTTFVKESGLKCVIRIGKVVDVQQNQPHPTWSTTHAGHVTTRRIVHTRCRPVVLIRRTTKDITEDPSVRRSAATRCATHAGDVATSTRHRCRPSTRTRLTVPSPCTLRLLRPIDNTIDNTRPIINTRSIILHTRCRRPHGTVVSAPVSALSA